MQEDTKKSKKDAELEQHLGELTADLQRVQADFINYRRRAEEERKAQNDMAKAATIMKLLPIIDDIERATAHTPAELANNTWAQGVVSLSKNLQKSLVELGLHRIESAPGTVFDPNLHEAVSMEDGEGDEEVVSEELRAGYQLGTQVVRPAMVRVTHRPAQPQQPTQELEQPQNEEENHG